MVNLAVPKMVPNLISSCVWLFIELLNALTDNFKKVYEKPMYYYYIIFGFIVH